MDNPQTEYTPPVSHLLTLGVPDMFEPDHWEDYVGTFGFTSEHIPELMRLAKDETFYTVEYDDRPEIYAPDHALRVLGQLQDESVLPFLLDTLENEPDNDWIQDVMPDVVAVFGPSAIPSLKTQLEQGARAYHPGAALVDCFERMAKLHPETRDVCVAILTAQLAQADQNDPTVNGFIVGALQDLQASESLPVMEHAFAQDAVDWTIAGDWDDVQVEFGLKAPDPDKVRPLIPGTEHLLETMRDSEPESSEMPPFTGERDHKKKKKAKRKQAQKSRKQNRKSKKR